MARNPSRGVLGTAQAIFTSIKQLADSELETIISLIAGDELLFDAIFEKSEASEQLRDAVKRHEEHTTNILGKIKEMEGQLTVLVDFVKTAAGMPRLMKKATNRIMELNREVEQLKEQ